MRILIAAFSVLMPTGSHAQSLFAAQAEPPPIFRIATDEFWLNLHHFLYLLGRAEAGTGDSTREAVAEAPREAERGMKTLTDEERIVHVEQRTAAIDEHLASRRAKTIAQVDVGIDIHHSAVENVELIGGTEISD